MKKYRVGYHKIKQLKSDIETGIVCLGRRSSPYHPPELKAEIVRLANSVSPMNLSCSTLREEVIARLGYSKKVSLSFVSKTLKEAGYIYKSAVRFKKTTAKDKRFQPSDLFLKARQIAEALLSDAQLVFLDQTKFIFPPYSSRFWHSKADMSKTLTDIRPKSIGYVECNCAYQLGKGFLGIVMSNESTNYSTFLYLSKPNKKVIFVLDNHSAHFKAMEQIKMSNPDGFQSFLLFNLPGISRLNAIENAFSKPKQVFYKSNNRSPYDLKQIHDLFTLSDEDKSGFARNYLLELLKNLAGKADPQPLNLEDEEIPSLNSQRENDLPTNSQVSKID